MNNRTDRNSKELIRKYIENRCTPEELADFLALLNAKSVTLAEFDEAASREWELAGAALSPGEEALLQRQARDLAPAYQPCQNQPSSPPPVFSDCRGRCSFGRRRRSGRIPACRAPRSVRGPGLCGVCDGCRGGSDHPPAGWLRGDAQCRQFAALRSGVWP